MFAYRRWQDAKKAAASPAPQAVRFGHPVVADIHHILWFPEGLGFI